MSKPSKVRRVFRSVFKGEEISNRGPDRMHVHAFIGTSDRLTWDGLLVFSGAEEADWCQYDTDQDAWYFGVWCNGRTREVLTYAEGDLTLQRYRDAAAYNAGIQEMNDFYGEGFIAKTLDDNGQWTIYRQDRADFAVGV